MRLDSRQRHECIVFQPVGVIISVHWNNVDVVQNLKLIPI